MIHDHSQLPLPSGLPDQAPATPPARCRPARASRRPRRWTWPCSARHKVRLAMLHRPAAAPVLKDAAQLLHDGIRLASCSEQRHTPAKLTDHLSSYPLKFVFGLLAARAALRIFCSVLGATISSEFFVSVTKGVRAWSNRLSTGGPFSASTPRHGTIIGSIWSSPGACTRCTHRSAVSVARVVAR